MTGAAAETTSATGGKVRARDHGVSSVYARRVRARDPGAGLDDVIRMRDRGRQPWGAISGRQA